MSTESEHWQNHPDRYWFGPRDGGGWGLYDRAKQDWAESFTGPDAQQQARTAATEARKTQERTRSQDDTDRAARPARPARESR